MFFSPSGPWGSGPRACVPKPHAAGPPHLPSPALQQGLGLQQHRPPVARSAADDTELVSSTSRSTNATKLKRETDGAQRRDIPWAGTVGPPGGQDTRLAKSLGFRCSAAAPRSGFAARSRSSLITFRCLFAALDRRHAVARARQGLPRRAGPPRCLTPPAGASFAAPALQQGRLLCNGCRHPVRMPQARYVEGPR